MIRERTRAFVAPPGQPAGAPVTLEEWERLEHEETYLEIVELLRELGWLVVSHGPEHYAPPWAAWLTTYYRFTPTDRETAAKAIRRAGEDREWLAALESVLQLSGALPRAFEFVNRSVAAEPWSWEQANLAEFAGKIDT